MSTVQSDLNIVELTQEKFDELKSEFENRQGPIREEIVNSISEARELGDLSENHPYKVAMEKLQMNENRISDLESMLKNAHIVTNSTIPSNIVTIGRRVKLLNKKTNKEKTFRLVGSETSEAADPLVGDISIDSPIGKAIFKAKVGSSVNAELPLGNVTFEIIGFVD